MNAGLLYCKEAGNQYFPQAILIAFLIESVKSERLAGTPARLKTRVCTL
jgi:hypothetical protein